MFWMVPHVTAIQSTVSETRIHIFSDFPVAEREHLFKLGTSSNFYFFHDIREYKNESDIFFKRYKLFHSHFEY